ncbi:hypothetical protein SEA_ECLIPTUS_53 [Gordonia phage Ecliptus]|nr:hypothetical protein SEA_ECLIPTUS_53 [Gordonia phage Ecliptus]
MTSPVCCPTMQHMATKINLDDATYDRNAREMHRARRQMLRKLVSIRKRREHSQADVARALGVARSTVCRFEDELENSNPTLDTVLRYAHAVGASIRMDAMTIEDRDRTRLGYSARFGSVDKDAPSSWSEAKLLAS